MPTVNTARGEIWFADHRREAPAPTALLIHGAGSSHLSFPREMRRHPGFNAILPDLPGHGRSPGPGRAEIRGYALDMAALLDALAVSSAVLIGHSMGGAIALWLAVHQPQRVSALVLAGSGARLPVNPALIASIVDDPPATIKRMLRWMWAKNAPAEEIAQSAEIMLATDPTVLQRDFIACDNFDIRHELSAIRAPTLVMAGEQDKMTPPKLSEELARSISGAESVVVPAAGHMLLLEQPAESAAAIGDWLHHASG